MGPEPKAWLTDTVFFHAGAYEVNPNTQRPTDNGIDWSTRGATGVVVPVELGYTTNFANDARPRNYEIGAIIDRSDYADPVLDTRGGASVFSGLGSLTQFGRSLIYARFDQMIWRPDPTSPGGLTLFGVATKSTGGRQINDYFLEAGLVQTGTFPGRPYDTVGFVASTQKFSSVGLANVRAAGIDVGKYFLDLGFHPAAKPLRCDNTQAGIEGLIDALRQRGVLRVALEAIGPYAYPVTTALAEAGFAVALVDPRRIRAFRTAEGQIAKTDRLDAALIARFAHRMPEHLHPAPEPDQVRLKALSTRRRQLTELIAMGKTRSAGDEPAALSDADWRRRLTSDQYAVLRQEGTERPFTSPILHEARLGRFACAGCDLPVFSSTTKFDSRTGWPSFWAPIAGAVTETRDTSFGTQRTAISCHRCRGHLGHVFKDGPKPTGLRYCMNGVALKFLPAA